MKYLAIVISVIVVLFLSSLEKASAQNDSIRHTLSANVGASLAGFIVKNLDLNDSVTTDSYPAFQLNYDYGIKKWFSIGLATSYQQFNLTYTDYDYLSDEFGILSGKIEGKLTRTNFAARALFHYGNTDFIDMYSGFRLGYTQWKLTAEYSDIFSEQDVIKYGALAPQLVLFGFRGYVTDHIGLGAEIGIGPPSYFSAGLNVRL